MGWSRMGRSGGRSGPAGGVSPGGPGWAGPGGRGRARPGSGLFRSVPVPWARVCSSTMMLKWGAAPCLVPAVPESRAAWQAAVSPSIRRCAAVRVSSVPSGGPKACTAVLMISADSVSPHAPVIVPAWSRVRPKDRCRRSNRLRSRSSAAVGVGTVDQFLAQPAQPAGIKGRGRPAQAKAAVRVWLAVWAGRLSLRLRFGEAGEGQHLFLGYLGQRGVGDLGGGPADHVRGIEGDVPGD
jgi:hypothetical protein